MVRFTIILSILVSISIFASAQKVDTTTTPSRNEIATEFLNRYSNQEEIIFHTYQWIVENFHYSIDPFRRINLQQDDEAKLDSALLLHQGVCENFAGLMADILSRCNLIAFSVEGYTDQQPLNSLAGHSWCVVKTNKGWKCYDPTWDLGVTHWGWYEIAPEKFIDTHLPFDPMWQFQKIKSASYHFKYNFQSGNGVNEEEINDYISSVTANRMESAIKRIKNAGVTTALIRNYLASLEFKLSLIHEENDEQLYNSAVDNLNSAIKILNESYSIHNSLSTEKSESISRNFEKLQYALSLLKLLNAKVEVLRGSAYNQQYNPDALEKRVEQIKKKLFQELERVKMYITKK